MTPPSPAAGKDPRLLIRDPEGLNAGPPPALLGSAFVTPAPLFFTRSHAPPPAVDAGSWRLRVGGLARRPAEFSLADLRSGFANREVTATLMCAGLRRTELTRVRPVPGELPWDLEPVGTAVWSGVALKDLLAVVDPERDAAHAEFVGLDRVERHGRTFGFGGSIPLAKALGEEVLLAHSLNGAPLPAEHGFPLRAIVPGYIGARSVKWLGEIRLLTQPSDNYFQAEAYRVRKEPDPANPRSVRDGVELGEVPLLAVVLSPGEGDRLVPGDVTVSGWALGAAGAPPARVEVSGDGGRTWLAAGIVREAGPWAWRFWRATIRLGAGSHTIVARAWDSAGRGQPERLEDAWNVKGYVNDAWHRVTITIEG